MNIAIEKNSQQTINKYPWVGEYENWVVLFVKYNTGIILSSDEGDYPNGSVYPFSNEQLYKPWFGKITIEV
jgi:hypothetical protein